MPWQSDGVDQVVPIGSGTSSPSLEDFGAEGLSPPPRMSPVVGEARVFSSTALRRTSDGKSVHAALENVSFLFCNFFWECSVGIAEVRMGRFF